MAQSIADQFGGKVATAPIKSRERTLKKIVNDYGGDASRIKDLARNTIVVPADQIDSVVSALAHNGAAVKRIDAATDPLGYSGVNSSLKTKNGITGEIQVNSPEMIYAKETPKNARAILGDDVYDSISAKTGIEGGLGHKLYEQWRALPKGNQGRLPLEAQSKAYYDAIRSKAGISATNSKNLDNVIGDGRPVSGHTGYLGSPRLTRRELQTYKQELASIGINFEKNGDKFLPPKVRGGFNWGNETVYLRKGATDFEAFHEAAHAKQFVAVGGRKAYEDIGRYGRESHVFNEIYKSRHRFSYEERVDAVRYMRDLRELYRAGEID